MNDTKHTLFKISAVISIIDSVGMFLSSILILSSLGYYGKAQTGNGYAINDYGLSRTGIILICVFILLFATASLVGGILLLKNDHSKARFVWGIVLSIIGAGIISLPAILIYVGLAINPKEEYVIPQEPVKKQNPVSYEQKLDDQKLKRQIEVLRQMRNNGEITDQEFKELMFDLIKKS